MNLFKEWEKINQEKFSSSTIKKEEIMQAISKESSLTINELKKRLKHKINWVIFFILAFIIWFILSISHPTVLPVIGFIIVLYIIGFILLWNQYKKIDAQIDPNTDVLTAMKKNANILNKALKHKKYFGLMTLPIAAACGLMVSDLYSGQTVLEILSNSKSVIKIIGFIIFFVPLMSIFSHKMNDIAYGDYIKKLQKNIRKMEELV